MSREVTLRGTVALGLGVALLAGLCVMAAGGLAIAAGVAALVPQLGLAGALLAMAGVLFGLALVAVQVLRARVRRLQAKRAALAPLAGVIEIALMLLPRKRLAELEVWLAAGLAAGLSVSALVKRRA